MKIKPTIVFASMVLLISSIGMGILHVNENIISNQRSEEQVNSILAQTPQTLLLNDELGKYSLGYVLELFEDKDKKLTLEDVVTPELSDQFAPSKEEIPNMGFNDSAYWMRFRIRNEATQVTTWWLELSTANINIVDIYQIGPDGEIVSIEHTGNRLPFDKRGVNHRYFIFRMTLPYRADRTVYMRVENVGSTILPLRIFSRQEFTQKDYAQQFILGTFYGILVIMICHNLLLFLTLHEKSYGYYVLFTVTFLMSQLAYDGLSKQYLWPAAMRWSVISETFFTAAFSISAFKFASVMLMTKTHTPSLHKMINIATWLLLGMELVLCLPFVNLYFSFQLIYVLILLGFLTLFTANVIIWRKGYRPARYYILAWMGFSIGLGIIMLVRVGLLPSNLLTKTVLQAGAILLILVLSLALADRINIIKQEKEKAQEETLQLKDRLNLTLQKVNEELELRVEERTRDITFLYEITTIAGETLDLRQMFERFLGRVSNVLSDSPGFIHLLDPSERTLELAASASTSQETFDLYEYESITLEGTPWGRVVTTNCPLVIVDSTAHSDTVEEQSYHSYVGVPIRIGGKCHGTLSAISQEKLVITDEKIEVLVTAAEQIGIAIERVRLRQQNEQSILVNERQRLARELHDVVTQSLYSLELFISGGQDHARNGNVTKVQSYFAEIGDITHEILIEMRLLLHELQPLTLKSDGLIKAIRNRLDAVERRINVGTKLKVEEYVELPEVMQMGLYRVTQEALNNAIKHSKANHVSVRVYADNSKVELEISDDGVGFDTKNIRDPGMGLGNLRERVQSLGGKLTIESNPGKGTKILAIFAGDTYGE